MKSRRNLAIGIGAMIGLSCLAALGFAAIRPDRVPSWARPTADRLAVLVRGDAPMADVATDEGSGLFCPEHGVPEKFCTLCHPELQESLLLCKEHGDIPEDICTLCHPEVEQEHGLVMCEEHGLPESFCYKCGAAGASSALPAEEAWCAPHEMPEVLCEACPDVDPGSAEVAECQAPALPTVRLASAGLADRIGLETAEATADRHAHRLDAIAETAFDGNRYAEVFPRVRGYLREVRADLGDRVHAGDVLAVIDSAEVGAAKSRFLSATAALEMAETNHRRAETLARRDAVSAKDALEALTDRNRAEAELMGARQALLNLGLDEEALKAIDADEDLGNLLEIVAPIEGDVVNRHAVLGEAVEATTRLFAVADTSKLWVWIDLPESDAGLVADGQPVTFSVGGPGARSAPAVAEGRVTWMGSEIDPVTRTARIRAEVDNPGARFRANQFGRASIRVGTDHDAVLVPEGAVQHAEDGTAVVFLPDGPRAFRPHRVLTKSAGRPDLVEVSWGLEPGQRVVTRGSFLLKTELMRGAIGAGCCE